MSAGAPPGSLEANPAPDARNFSAEVQALVANVVNLANHIGDDASAELLEERASIADTTATIVVAGEAKQGKSSLINSLVGVVGLSPVDSDVATAVPLRIGHGPNMAATLNLINGDRLTIDPAELPGWVSMAGADLERLRQVKSVELVVPSALLEPGVVLVDTPGVGGLVAGHARMTLRSLESATAMLFVTDADTKLTRPELDFLARASERIAAVAFVITRIDATPAWRRVLEEDRDVLARHAPRYADAPIVPVSARLADRARAVADIDPSLAADLWTDSGLEQVQDWISRRIRPVAATLAIANTAALSRTMLARLVAIAQRNLAAASADPAVSAAFEAERSRVAGLRNQQMTWGTTLERRLFEARIDLREQVKASSEALKASGAALVKAAKSRDIAPIVAQIDAELDAQAQDLSDALRDAVTSVCARMLDDLDIANPLQVPEALSNEATVRPFEPATKGVVNMLSGGMAAATGWGIVARLAPTIGVGSVLAGAALPLLGAVVFGFAIQHIRGTATRRAELSSWVRNEIERATSERYADVERALISAKLDATEVIRAALVEREREASIALEQARAAKARSDQQREARQNLDRQLLATTTTLTASADELLAALLATASLDGSDPAGHEHTVSRS